jgi:hypothetical protein
MGSPANLRCDGCGQVAGSEHLARRFARLERTTRYRPVHIQALLLSAVVPTSQASFLYAAEGPFEGEARSLLESLQIASEGTSRAAALSEFQKRGLFLSHVLECPVEGDVSIVPQLIERQLPAALVRIRRSVKAKKIVVISKELLSMVDHIASEVGCPITGIDLTAKRSEMGQVLDAGELLRRSLAATGAA